MPRVIRVLCFIYTYNNHCVIMRMRSVKLSVPNGDGPIIESNNAQRLNNMQCTYITVVRRG